MDGANVELNEDNVVIQTTTNGNASECNTLPVLL